MTNPSCKGVWETACGFADLPGVLMVRQEWGYMLVGSHGVCRGCLGDPSPFLPKFISSIALRFCRLKGDLFLRLGIH